MADLQRDFIFFNQTVHALHIFNSKRQLTPVVDGAK